MIEKTDIRDSDEKVVEIEMERLRNFTNHPFKVIGDSQMIELQDSIKKYGVLNPLIVRPRKEGYYEIISAHRRKYAAERLGYKKIPVIIRMMQDDEAVVTMVDSNLQREQITPSEKAYENQIMYQKVGKMPTITDLQADFIPLHEAAALLGITKEKMSVITRASRFKDCFEIQVFEDKKWISKKSFQHFLNAQSVYQVVKKPEQVKQDNQESMETKEYISRSEAAALAGVTSGTITKWMQMERFSCVGAGKVLRINRKEFLQWLKEYQEGAG